MSLLKPPSLLRTAVLGSWAPVAVMAQATPPSAPSGEAIRVTVSTYAGAADQPGAQNGARTQARLNDPHGVVVGADGTLYISEAGNQILRAIKPDGTVYTLAGSPDQAGGVDGSGEGARFNLPNSIARNKKGELFIADLGNQAIREVTPLGKVTTWAGHLGAIGSADGPGPSARFSRPHGIAVGPDGTIFVADAVNQTIRKITRDGVVYTLAGEPNAPGAKDGRGSEARFWMPYGITVDAHGNLYVVERENHTLRKITPEGVVTTLAGKFNEPGHVDGPGPQARFSSPRGITIDAAGNLYVADYDSCLIRRVTPDGFVTTLAGQADVHGHADGPGRQATFNGPHGLAFNAHGKLFVADSDNHEIRVLTFKAR